MAYIDGKNLRIFPATIRSASDRAQDNWLTEFNLSSIINQLVGGNSKGFVITESPADGSPFEFNIGGYYFKVSDIKNIKDCVNSETKTDEPSSFISFNTEEDSGTTYYTAKIIISSDTSSPILLGSDGGEIPESGNELTLRLFYLKDGKYVIPPTSRLSLIALRSLKVMVPGQVQIDDGEI